MTVMALVAATAAAAQQQQQQQQFGHAAVHRDSCNSISSMAARLVLV